MVDASMLETRLRAALGGDAGALVFGNEVPVKHHADWSRLAATPPLALARPRTTEHVAAILRVCNETRTPVVPQGGLTGLVGGAHPVQDCVALSLERMAGVESLYSAGSRMTVLAGTTLESAQVEAASVGLMLALDLGARGSCTVGGNLATNAGGNRVILHGTARDQVLGLEAVLADGTVLSSMNGLVKNNTGYDLKHLFIGSEGTLGVITRAVLRLRPRPTSVSTALCAVGSPADLTGLLSALRTRLGPSLSAFEAMWPDFWTAMTTTMGKRSPFDRAHGAYALVEMSGFDPGSDEERLQAALADIAEAGTLADAVIAQTEGQAADFWAIREAVGHLRGVLGPLTSFDVGIESKAVQAFAEAAAQQVQSRWPDAVHLTYGHLGDDNIHIVVHVPSAGVSQPKEEIDHAVYELVRAYGGSVSAEHGIGLSKRAYLGSSRTEPEILTMREIKRVLDPNGIMNPGKIFIADNGNAL